MKFIPKIAAGALLSAAALAVTAPVASAETVCNDYGCYHVHRHHLRFGLGVRVNPDRYYYNPYYDGYYYNDRGYWRDGVWIRF